MLGHGENLSFFNGAVERGFRAMQYNKRQFCCHSQWFCWGAAKTQHLTLMSTLAALSLQIA